MKYRVKLKTTVYAWVSVDLDDALREGGTEHDMREWAADVAVAGQAHQLRDRLGSLDHGPIELAFEELDESVEAVA